MTSHVCYGISVINAACVLLLLLCVIAAVAMCYCCCCYVLLLPLLCVIAAVAMYYCCCCYALLLLLLCTIAAVAMCYCCCCYVLLLLLLYYTQYLPCFCKYNLYYNTERAISHARIQRTPLPALIKPIEILDSSYIRNSGQWVIQVNDADAVSTLG